MVMILTIAVVLGFQDSTSLSSAYGKVETTAIDLDPLLKEVLTTHNI